MATGIGVLAKAAFQLEGDKVIQFLEDGVSTVGTANFTSAGAEFQTRGVKTGDSLVVLIILDGNDAGTYVVDAVSSNTALTITTTFGTGDTAETYYIIQVDEGYPESVADAELAEVILWASDLLPLRSESINDSHEFEDDKTIIGVSGVSDSDLVKIDPNGGITMALTYGGLDQIIGAALGYENPLSPTAIGGTSATALTSTSQSSAEATSSFTPVDVGKFIKVSGTSDQCEGQVRKISAYVGPSEVTVSPPWRTITNIAGDTYFFSQGWLHQFEPSNLLMDQLWSDLDASSTVDYPTSGVGESTDKIMRRGTLGFEKTVTEWIFRSCMVNALTLDFKSGGSAEITAEMIPFDLSKATTKNADPTTWNLTYNSSALTNKNSLERVLFNDLQYIRVDEWHATNALTSADNQAISAVSININNNLKADDMTVSTGLYRTYPVRGNFREITGTFEIPRYDAATWTTWLTSETKLMAEIVAQGTNIPNAGSNPYSLNIYLLTFKITNVNAPIEGANVITQTVEWKAYLPSAAPAGLITPKLTLPIPEIVIQTQNANPYNVFRNQEDRV